MNLVSFSTSAMHSAAKRAGLAQSPQAHILSQIATEIEANLTAGEFVLELAETTAPGFHSLAAITNQRILIGAGPGALQEIPLAPVTSWQEVPQPNLGLELRVFDSKQVITGLGNNGIRRLQHALAWVGANAQKGASSEAVSDVEELRNQWRQSL